MRLAHYIVETLSEYGMRYEFMVTGGVAMHLNNAFSPNREIGKLCCHHHQSSAIGAESHLWVANRWEAVNVKAGPGLSNEITGDYGFGFMLRVKPSAPFTHTDLARHLDEKKIGNRMFFGGNLLRQPVFVQLRKDRPEAFRVISAIGKALTPAELELQLSTSTAANGAASPLPGADAIMNQALFLGTYPGLTREMMDYEIDTIHAFVSCLQKNKL
jgi:hypothetical protein